MTDTPFVSTEIATQPDLWRQVSTGFAQYGGALPTPGQRVAAVGCGTSWFMAMAYAALREDLGQGLTDAFAGSEFPAGREYDAVVVISRSGTTTEVLELIRQTSLPTIAITATPGSPIVDLADQTILLDFADEQSVVQTRFATTTLALLRASLGEDLTQAAADAETALTVDVDELAKLEQVTYLGTRWTVGLAHEAGLKQREAASAWTEAYPAMDYRHGPIAIAQPGRGVWIFGTPPEGLLEDVAGTGATIVHHPDLDPMASLVVAQRVAVAKSLALGLNPDQPRSLTRSVILD
ncbi:fructoselysine-6-P-deglycase FrlB-like protein [Kribbella orskensis]|uniref:Fructoselysine-6-P-deglycase FrlB-like protein n=1 Tax=Kribbella orskensis TaxID=2512216 RepID=A0ABY2BBZ4_9ACTN|nr:MULTISPECIES: SIS domain-containing protein [Kribbella]TCN34836.1 fructoselysine-6-P-deglycase FrlB-like protein [Kribbella sp. VKM Ac-2500]TCO15541.1 fructoselysine-6-P-deglycase FrlB-like protein [Kribbella orskensis]